jgi:hypothetical protein
MWLLKGAFSLGLLEGEVDHINYLSSFKKLMLLHHKVHVGGKVVIEIL